MDSSDKLHQLCKEINEDCISCGQCVSECKLLQRIDEDPTMIAKRGPSVQEAYACSLCGLCEAVCPVLLSMRNMFAETRTNAVECNFIDINEYRYMFPDRKINAVSLYREVNGINYDDLHADQEGSIAFFPGCTMLTYTPELIKELFVHLNKEYKNLTLNTDCCGLPLGQLGLQNRRDDYVRKVKLRLTNNGVKTLITACPNCYYQLRPILEDTEIKVITIYEALENAKIFEKKELNSQDTAITLHDSCPDRFYGVFAQQTRELLIGQGYQLIEMEHHRDKTICCGSGGQVTHFQPDLAEELVKARQEEADSSGAQILTGYCVSCVLNFARIPSNIKVQHVLNLLLGIEQDYNGIKAKAKQLFEGPEGEKNWEKIMAE